MRNRILFLIGIIGVCFLSGCESRGFRAEREMWRAHKQAQAIYKNPKGTPPYELQEAQDAYRAIIKKYPDSLFAVQAGFSIGHLYLARGDFDKAREAYKRLAVDCDKKGNLCAEAHFVIGNSYEFQDRWDKALAEYRLILGKFPFSAKSLDLPLYIIRHYSLAKDEVGAKRSVDEAISYYSGLKAKTQAQRGDYVLQGLISRAYGEAGQWQDAADNLEKLARDYPAQRPEEAILLKAFIYLTKLNDIPKGKNELQRILKDYPQSKLTKQAESILKKLPAR